jgi:hypothetical protein
VLSAIYQISYSTIPIQRNSTSPSSRYLSIYSPNLQASQLSLYNQPIFPIHLTRSTHLAPILPIYKSPSFCPPRTTKSGLLRSFFPHHRPPHFTRIKVKTLNIGKSRSMSVSSSLHLPQRLSMCIQHIPPPHPLVKRTIPLSSPPFLYRSPLLVLLSLLP